MFVLHYKPINMLPCNNVTYNGDFSKNHTRAANKTLSIYHNNYIERKDKK